MKKIYDQAIDTLRLISILAVVAIHTTTRAMEITHYDLRNQLFTLYLNQAARFAVPLFFLISGFVLELNYNSQINYFVYLKKRLTKILIPYIFWSFIYFYFVYTNHSENFLKSLLTGDASYQLYFIPSLLIFYLVFPLLHRCYRILRGVTILSVLFIIEIAILNYDYVHFSFPLPYPIAVALFNFFVFIFGMFLSRSRENLINFTKKYWFIFLIATSGLSYFIFKEGFNNYYKQWNFEAFYTQWRPSILIYTITVFLILYFLANKFSLRILNQVSKLSFFVFFIHVIILEILSKYLANNDLLFFAGVSIISILIAYLVHKLPYIEKLTG